MTVTINGTTGVTTPGLTNTGDETIAGNVSAATYSNGQLAGQRNKIINGVILHSRQVLLRII